MRNVKRHELVEFIKRHGYIVGVFVGFKSNKGSSKIGWSLCHPNDYESNDYDSGNPDFKKAALNLARKRAIEQPSFRLVNSDIPPSILEDFMRFNNRCARYFKDREFVAVAEKPAKPKASFQTLKFMGIVKVAGITATPIREKDKQKHYLDKTGNILDYVSLIMASSKIQSRT